jgi:hypothetical protein
VVYYSSFLAGVQMTKELEQLIQKILQLKTPLSLTINFDGNGNYKLESKLGHKALMEDGCIEAINKLITNKKE